MSDAKRYWVGLMPNSDMTYCNVVGATLVHWRKISNPDRSERPYSYEMRRQYGEVVELTDEQHAQLLVDIERRGLADCAYVVEFDGDVRRRLDLHESGYTEDEHGRRRFDPSKWPKPVSKITESTAQ